MNRCDPLLAGLPRDPDYCVPHRLPPSPPINPWPNNEKRGSSSDKPLDSKTCWDRDLESEIVGPTCPEHVRSSDWDSEWEAHGESSYSSPDPQKESYHGQELKRHHNSAKKSLDPSCCKAKAKSNMIIPDSQKLLRCDLESLRNQLQAQTKAFEFLNHSVTMLEKESCLQQIKIQQLQEMLGNSCRQGEKEGRKWSADQGRQELYGALAQGLRGLQKTLREGEEVQRSRTTRCLQLLAQEIRDSKKFLWEELELVREEVTFIYQKLQAQEEEISENLLNIHKMQKTQVKCRKVLTKMKHQGCDPPSWQETEELPAEGNNVCWKDDLQKELRDIWSAVHGLQDSIDSLAMSSGCRPRESSLRGQKGHRCLSPPHLSWDSDSDWDRTFSKSRSFPSA